MCVALHCIADDAVVVVIDAFRCIPYTANNYTTLHYSFDPHFNAITGLNGSGKSNILDAICFVLGITNLSQVRAGNLSELVYKQGQAGVTKATVSIVFDNSDPSSSPFGFEQSSDITVTRHVLLGGKSKYTINGRSVPASTVHNLFRSVQLNVNNPHFLIMQGRITKVLNMRSHEILGMVEEAAGTKLYQDKRTSCLKTLERKEQKVHEIQTIVQEDIAPTLERLQGEKQNYLKWSKNSADVERLERLCVAYQFYTAQQALQTNQEGVAELQTTVDTLERDEQTYRDQIQAKQESMAQAMSVLNGTLEAELATTKQTEQEHSRTLVRDTSKWKNSQATVQQAQTDLTAAQELVHETNQAMQDKETELEQCTADTCLHEAEQAAQALTELQQQVQHMSAGLTHQSLPEQIRQAHTDSATAQAHIDKAQLTVQHTAKELTRVEQALSRAGQSAARLADKKAVELERVQQLEETIQRLDFSDTAFEALEDQKTELESIVPELTEQVRTLQARINGRLQFEYTDPVRGFDRSKVKGTVASLVQVTDANYTTALEVVAGGKLFQVVVDEAVTGKALLGRGQLKKRCTIIPLDKIQARHVTAQAVQRADRIAQTLQTTARPAIELVGFDEELRNAMEYVFGASIVAGSKEAAEQICFATKTRVITTEGDIYDPSGTVSGGSKGNFGTTLAQLVELSELTATLAEKQAALRAVVAQWEALQASKTEYDSLASQLNLAQAQLQATEKHLSQTSFGLLVEQKKAFAADLQQAQDEIAAMTEQVAEKRALYERLQAQEGELTQQREEEMRELETAVQDAKVRAAETTKLAADVESRSQLLTIELENLQKELAAAEEAVRAANALLNEALQKEAELQARVEEAQLQYEESRTQVENLEQNFANCSQEVDGIKNEIADMSKLAETAKLEAKKAAVAITRIRKEREGAERTVAAMLNKYTWIEGEQSAFGVSGGDYDFAAADPEAARRQLKELKGEQDNLVCVLC